MPFALADLVPIAAGLFLLLLAVCIAQLTNYFNGIVPNPSILGVKPFQWFHDELGDINQWSNDAAEAAIRVMHDVITDTGWIFGRLVAVEKAAIGVLSGNIFYTVHTLLPNAAASSTAYTNQQVAAAETAATNAVARAEALEHTDVLNLQANINRVVDTTMPAYVSAALAPVISDLNQDVKSLQSNIDTVTNDLNADLADVWANITPLQTAVSSTIPAEFAAQGAKEVSDVNAAEALAQFNLVAAVSAINAEIDNITREIAAQNVVITTAEGQISTLNQESATFASDVLAINATISTAQQKITALQGQAAALKTEADSSAASIVTLSQTQTITLPALPDVVSPGVVVVPLAVGALAYAVSDIITEIDRCMVTICEGPNNISNLLQGILGGVSLAELAAFLAAAEHDPSGEAHAFASLAGGLYNDGHALIDALLSI